MVCSQLSLWGCWINYTLHFLLLLRWIFYYSPPLAIFGSFSRRDENCVGVDEKISLGKCEKFNSVKIHSTHICFMLILWVRVSFFKMIL